MRLKVQFQILTKSQEPFKENEQSLFCLILQSPLRYLLDMILLLVVFEKSNQIFRDLEEN